ncbi:MAG: amidohydrolase [bacterium]|nr:amidohydrolase [bacterium]
MRHLTKGVIPKIIVMCLLVVFFVNADAFARENPDYTQIRLKVDEYYPEAVKIYQHLHKHPEMCFEETDTSNYITDYLKKCNLEVQTGLAKGTGIKAILKGGKSGPVVGIRADIDALLIQEENDLEFKSVNKGIMHACGHDVHTTNVMIAARILSEMKENIAGTIVFVFQPCEEGAPDGSCGADAMIKSGVLENPKIDAMFGLHVYPGQKVGSVFLKEGGLTSSCDTVKITITGKNAHGARPQEGIDSIYSAASAIMQFQGIISRKLDPTDMGVLTIGKINGGTSLNVIAAEVKMEGTVRTFTDNGQDLIEKEIGNVLDGLEKSMGVTCELDYHRDFKYVKNDPDLHNMVTPLFNKLIGEENVFPAEQLSGSEDFAFYSHEIPCYFFFMGSGNESPVHTPTFSIEEETLKYGPLLLSAAALEYLEKGTSK